MARTLVSANLIPLEFMEMSHEIDCKFPQKLYLKICIQNIPSYKCNIIDNIILNHCMLKVVIVFMI